MKHVVFVVRDLGEVDDLCVAPAKKPGDEKSNAGLIA
jgi:hypothetical protein